MNKQSDRLDLRKLSRRELLELMVQQNRKIDELTAKLAEAEQKLQDRTIVLEHSGSIADAALKLSGIFEAAQHACDQYEESVRARCAALEQQTRDACRQKLAEAGLLCDTVQQESDEP